MTAFYIYTHGCVCQLDIKENDDDDDDGDPRSKPGEFGSNPATLTIMTLAGAICGANNHNDKIISEIYCKFTT